MKNHFKIRCQCCGKVVDKLYEEFLKVKSGVIHLDCAIEYDKLIKK